MFTALKISEGQLSAFIGAVFLFSTTIGSVGIRLIWGSYCNTKLKREGLVYLDERPSSIDGMSLLQRFRSIRGIKRTKENSPQLYDKRLSSLRVGHNEIIILSALLFLSFMAVGSIVTPLGIQDSGIRDISFSEDTEDVLCLPTTTGDRSQEPFMAQAVEYVTSAHCAGLNDHTPVGSASIGEGSIYSARGRPESAKSLVTGSKLSLSFELDISYDQNNAINLSWDSEQLLEQGAGNNTGFPAFERVFIERSVEPLILTGKIYFTQLMSTREKERLIGFSCIPLERGPWERGTRVTVALHCWSFFAETSLPGISLLSVRPSTIALVLEKRRERGSCQEVPGGVLKSTNNSKEAIEETARLVAASQQVGIILAVGEECGVRGESMKVPTSLTKLSMILLVITAIVGVLLFFAGLVSRFATRKMVNWCGDTDRIINLASNRQESTGGNSKDLAGASGWVAVIHFVEDSKEMRLRSYHASKLMQIPQPVQNADAAMIDGTWMLAD